MSGAVPRVIALVTAAFVAVSFAYASSGGGVKWQPRVELASDEAERTLHVAWAERPSGTTRRIQYTRTKDGVTFEPARIVSNASASGHFPQLAVDRSDRVLVLWEQYVREDARPQALGFAHSTDGGAHFTSPTTVPSIAGPTLGMNGSQQGGLGRKLAVDGAGGSLEAERDVLVLRGRSSP